MASIYPVKLSYLRKIKVQGRQHAEIHGKIYNIIRKTHPILGSLIVLIGLYHGWIAFGRFPLHTGTLVLGTIILMGLVALLGPKIKGLRKSWRSIHRGLGFLLFLLVIIHIYWRNLI